MQLKTMLKVHRLDAVGFNVLQEYEEVKGPDDGSFEEKIQEQELIYYQYKKQRQIAKTLGADPEEVEIPEKAKEYMVRGTINCSLKSTVPFLTFVRINVMVSEDLKCIIIITNIESIWHRPL